MLAVSFYEKINTAYRIFHIWTCFCHNLNPWISLYSVKEVTNLSVSIRKKRGRKNHSEFNYFIDVFLLPLLLPPKTKRHFGKTLVGVSFHYRNYVIT